jgi:hypothetical protein
MRAEPRRGPRLRSRRGALPRVIDRGTPNDSRSADLRGCAVLTDHVNKHIAAAEIVCGDDG